MKDWFKIRMRKKIKFDKTSLLFLLYHDSKIMIWSKYFQNFQDNDIQTTSQWGLKDLEFQVFSNRTTNQATEPAISETLLIFQV